PAKVAIICLRMLRVRQTRVVRHTNEGSLLAVPLLEDVQTVLEKLSSPAIPFLMQLPRRPGQKEARYAHLLGGIPEFNDEAEDTNGKHTGSLEVRVAKLENDLAELKDAFDKLMKQLT